MTEGTIESAKQESAKQESAKQESAKQEPPQTRSTGLHFILLGHKDDAMHE